MPREDLPPRLVDALAVALRAVSRPLQEALDREEGVTLDQWRTLRALHDSRGTTMGELADRLQIPSPSLTRIVDTLVDRALVYRSASSLDRRRVEVYLSDSGATLLRRLEAIAAAHETRYRPSSELDLTALIADLTAIPPGVGARHPGKPADPQ